MNGVTTVIASGLIGETHLHFTGASRVSMGQPAYFRIAEYPDGTKVMQGGTMWREGWDAGVDWADLKTVKVNESGQEVK